MSQISRRTECQLNRVYDFAPMDQFEVSLNTSRSCDAKDNNDDMEDNNDDMEDNNDDMEDNNADMEDNNADMEDNNDDMKEAGEDEKYPKVRTAEESLNTNQENSDTHVQRTSKRPLLECDICKKILKSRSSFRRHSFIHENQRQFCCEFCGLGFNSVSTLMGHRRVHMGERPYKCRYCDRTFVESSNRRTHERRHTGEKPYICDVCGRQFSVSCSLVRHRRIHTDETPYSCVFCDKSFRQYNGLRNHMEKNHRYLSDREIKMHCVKRDDNKAPSERQHVCFCGKAFRHYYQLENHRLAKHGPFGTTYRVEVKTEDGGVATNGKVQMLSDSLEDPLDCGWFKPGVVPKRAQVLDCPQQGDENNGLVDIQPSVFSSEMQNELQNNVVPPSFSNTESQNVSDVDQFVVLRNVRL